MDMDIVARGRDLVQRVYGEVHKIELRIEGGETKITIDCHGTVQGGVIQFTLDPEMAQALGRNLTLQATSARIIQATKS